MARAMHGLIAGQRLAKQCLCFLELSTINENAAQYALRRGNRDIPFLLQGLRICQRLSGGLFRICKISRQLQSK